MSQNLMGSIKKWEETLINFTPAELRDWLTQAFKYSTFDPYISSMSSSLSSEFEVLYVEASPILKDKLEQALLDVLDKYDCNLSDMDFFCNLCFSARRIKLNGSSRAISRSLRNISELEKSETDRRKIVGVISSLWFSTSEAGYAKSELLSLFYNPEYEFAIHAIFTLCIKQLGGVWIALAGDFHRKISNLDIDNHHLDDIYKDVARNLSPEFVLSDHVNRSMLSSNNPEAMIFFDHYLKASGIDLDLPFQDYSHGLPKGSGGFQWKYSDGRTAGNYTSSQNENRWRELNIISSGRARKSIEDLILH